MITKFCALLTLVVSTFAITVAAAPYQYPDSPEERAAVALELERKWEQTKEEKTLAHLAIIYSVIVGLDDRKQETVHKAEEYLNRAGNAFPKDYTLMAAHGSVLTMMAQFETKTANKLKFVKQGTRKLDRAVRKAPDNIEVLMQRGHNSLALPAFLNRAHFAQKDFQAVLKTVGDEKGPQFKAMLLYKLGKAYQITEDFDKAATYWKQAVQLDAPKWSAKASCRGELHSEYGSIGYINPHLRVPYNEIYARRFSFFAANLANSVRE